MKKPPATLDLVGIGIGPSNLSLAALLEPYEPVSSCFYDLKKTFQWHPGMLFPEATIQVSYLKDLVTLVDPTNRFSFLNFLATQKRLYRFSTAGFPNVKRREFNQYYQWVAGGLNNLQFDTTVQDVNHRGSTFSIRHSRGKVKARQIVIATGQQPKVPEFARPLLCDNIFHVSQFLDKNIAIQGKRIAVIGGGQSGAEIVQRLLADRNQLPNDIYWISKRANFLPLDDSPFVNEYFFPSYSDYFYQLTPELKQKILREQTLASDGIDLSLLQDIYRELYELEFLEERGRICKLLNAHSLSNLKKNAFDWSMQYKNELNGETKSVDVDIVILATGFQSKLPPFLEPIADRIVRKNGRLVFNPDFSIQWHGPEENKIFVQNGARHAKGIADPNLSLASFRSAKIINSMLGFQLYDLDNESTALDWPEVKQPSAFIVQNGQSG